MSADLETVMTMQKKLAIDSKVNVWHISLYTILLNLWYSNNFQKQIKVTRGNLMKKAHIRSFTTYHKCIKELVDFGYITYIPSYDTGKGSIIEIVSK